MSARLGSLGDNNVGAAFERIVGVAARLNLADEQGTRRLDAPCKRLGIPNERKIAAGLWVRAASRRWGCLRKDHVMNPHPTD